MVKLNTIEYQHKLSNGKKIKAYEGLCNCCKCGKEFTLQTTDCSIFENPRCYKCFVENK